MTADDPQQHGSFIIQPVLYLPTSCLLFSDNFFCLVCTFVLRFTCCAQNAPPLGVQYPSQSFPFNDGHPCCWPSILYANNFIANGGSQVAKKIGCKRVLAPMVKKCFQRIPKALPTQNTGAQFVMRYAGGHLSTKLRGTRPLPGMGEKNTGWVAPPDQTIPVSYLQKIYPCDSGPLFVEPTA